MCRHSFSTRNNSKLGTNLEGKTMNEQRNMPELRGACNRAAEIRQQWSPAEKKRRAGLPPDTPWALLRTFFREDRRVGVAKFA
jgi:hypothetical protein